ncbi:MAG: cysteine methyltransferase [Gammaproteobacteria bacterium]|nr:MAG: cysteine methyltransferase [Gammaproteobacteria bacterium]
MKNLELNELTWQIVAAIPYGKVLTYGQVARLCGFPNHARYVGSTLKRLPKDTTLPWHRVVNAKGELSFPVGGDAYNRQRSLLEKEGIIFKKDKLSLAIYGVNN